MPGQTRDPAKNVGVNREMLLTTMMLKQVLSKQGFEERRHLAKLLAKCHNRVLLRSDALTKGGWLLPQSLGNWAMF